jgi:hypothetical protein
MSDDLTKQLLRAIQSLQADVTRCVQKVEALDKRMEKFELNWNGDGSPANRGWAGAIEALKEQVDTQMGRWQQIITWGNIPITLAIMYVWSHFFGNATTGQPPSSR